MKRLIALFLLLSLCLILSAGVYGAEIPRFCDTAGLVSESDAEALNRLLDAKSEAHNFDFVICTVAQLNGYDPADFASEVYDAYDVGAGINKDGVLLLISEYDRDWYIFCGGSGNTILNADARAYIADAMLPDLSAGNYADAFTAFANTAEELFESAEQGVVYRAPFPFVKRIGISLIISLIAALIVVGVMRGKLKSVAMQKTAANYVVPGSMVITQSSDRFLYHTVTRTARPKQTGSRGGGGGHSGSGGKF